MICKGIPFLRLMLLGIHLLPAVVLSDFRVLEKYTNEVVFQTASDLVRTTSCGGTLVKKSYLIGYDYGNACRLPPSPPVSAEYYGIDRNFQWVLLSEDSGKCDLKTKFRNAATAGYSGIIVGTELNTVSVVADFASEDLYGEEFIDGHLVNPLDIRVLRSERFANWTDFVLEVPSKSYRRCTEGNLSRWWRQWSHPYRAIILHVWKLLQGVYSQSIELTIILPSHTIYSGIQSVHRSMPKDINNELLIPLLVIVVGLGVIAVHVLLDFLRDYTKKLLKRNKSYSEERQQKPSIPTNTHIPRPPPSSSSSSSSSSTPPRRVSIDYPTFHRLNLGIPLDQPLTTAVVNVAYRQMSLKFHPDKNIHLSVDLQEKMRESFISKKKSKDALLTYCKV